MNMAHGEISDRFHSAANLAVGWQRLIGPALTISIVLFIYVLFQPLLVTRIAFIRWNEIVLAQVAEDLYGTDAVLFVVVFGFGIVAPMAKMIASLAIWHFVDVRRARSYSRLHILLGRLSMLDIMLLAVLVVAIKGTGIGSIEIKPALYVYVVLVVGSFLISLTMERVLLNLDNAAKDCIHS
jgi:paraquat-inducible protein A